MDSVDNLSDSECRLYDITTLAKGTIEEINRQLTDNRTFDKYKEIHEQYFNLCSVTADSKIKLETLKRLTFLNWYSILEPSFLTGIGNLDNSTIFNSYAILDGYIKDNKLDEEFIWMLSYYSSWDWIILTFSENKFHDLTNFVKNVDTTVSQIPKDQTAQRTMNNRGQMGIYWTNIISRQQQQTISP